MAALFKSPSTAAVTGVAWITSVRDAAERAEVSRYIDAIQPTLLARNVPFEEREIGSVNQLFDYLDQLATNARNGHRPIIHFVAHGDAKRGLCVGASATFVPWDRLIDKFRTINEATGNNLVVVLVSCFSFHIILEMHIAKAVPFFLLIAPQKEATFRFVGNGLGKFYDELFQSHDVLAAYNHLKGEFSFFHSEKMLLVSLARYVRYHCLGKGGHKRRERLLTEALGERGLATKPNRKMIRKTMKAALKPTQALVNDYVRKFMLGKKVAFNIDDVLRLARSGLDKIDWRKP